MDADGVFFRTDLMVVESDAKLTDGSFDFKFGVPRGNTGTNIALAIKDDGVLTVNEISALPVLMDVPAAMVITASPAPRFAS